MVFFGWDQQTFSLEVLERVILDTRFGKFSLKFGHCFGLCCGYCFGLCLWALLWAPLWALLSGSAWVLGLSCLSTFLIQGYYQQSLGGGTS